MGVCNCSMFCCTLHYVHSSIAIILMGKRELIALLNLSSWCLVMVERLFLAVPWGCLQFVIVVFPDHTHLLFLSVLSGSCMVEIDIHVCTWQIGKCLQDLKGRNEQRLKLFFGLCFLHPEPLDDFLCLTYSLVLMRTKRQ